MTVGPGDVTAVLVTRGDVDLAPIVESLPYGHLVVWNNAERPYDAGVYGRYVALAEVGTRHVFFQDDDCVVRNHGQLLDAYNVLAASGPAVVGNVLADDPARAARYHDTTLLGWGALFDRDLPARAFAQYERHYQIDLEFKRGLGAEIVFPMLSRSRSLELPSVDWLDDGGEVFRRENRMWRQPGFYDELDFWMARARSVRGLLTAEAA